MKFLSTIILLALFVCSCTNENNNSTVSTATTDSIPAPAAPETTEPAPKANSKYVALNASTYTNKIEEHQGVTFLNLVSIKQKNLKKTTNGLISRSDTLYEVQYIPFKDQELYLHSVVLENIKENDLTTSWCFSVVKNGSTIMEDHLISTDFFLSLRLEKMNVGDTELVFVGTKENGTTETLQVPYDGKKI
jgi:hypothetical protein